MGIPEIVWFLLIMIGCGFVTIITNPLFLVGRDDMAKSYKVIISLIHFLTLFTIAAIIFLFDFGNSYSLKTAAISSFVLSIGWLIFSWLGVYLYIKYKEDTM